MTVTECVKGPSAPNAEMEVGFDIIGPLEESPDGNIWKLVGVEVHSGIGWSQGMPDKTAATVLAAVQNCMAKMRLMHKHPDNVSVRFHTDMDMSFRGR